MRGYRNARVSFSRLLTGNLKRDLDWSSETGTKRNRPMLELLQNPVIAYGVLVAVVALFASYASDWI